MRNAIGGQRTSSAGLQLDHRAAVVVREWLSAWRGVLYTLNARRDVLRHRLGGLIIAAPPDVKVLAQRESSDLWSVLDLLIELPAVPVLGEITPRVSDVKLTSPGRSPIAGVQLGDAPEEILDTALELLERPPSDLATVARTAASQLIGGPCKPAPKMWPQSLHYTRLWG